MTHIKKLFLTLSLLAMQSACGMDAVTKKLRTDDEEWTLVKTNEDLAQHAKHIIACRPLEATNPLTTILLSQHHRHSVLSLMTTFSSSMHAQEDQIRVPSTFPVPIAT